MLKFCNSRFWYVSTHMKTIWILLYKSAFNSIRIENNSISYLLSLLYHASVSKLETTTFLLQTRPSDIYNLVKMEVMWLSAEMYNFTTLLQIVIKTLFSSFYHFNWYGHKCAKCQIYLTGNSDMTFKCSFNIECF